MKRTSTKVTLIIIILITAVVGYYAYLSNRRQVLREEAIMTLVDSTLQRDLSYDYPATPKEVIKYYSQILKCYYNEECTDEEIENLGYKARELYDTELLEQNEVGRYFAQLKNDIEDYRENKRRITGVAVSASTNVDTYSMDGFDFARLACGYTIVEGTQSMPTSIVYLLRKDQDKKWKIYGWDFAENVKLGQNQGENE